jgi:hypothetical protein
MRRQNLLYYKNATLLKNALSFFVQSSVTVALPVSVYNTCLVNHDMCTVTDTIFLFINKISDLSEVQIVCYLRGLILDAKCILLPTLLMIEILLRKNENLLSF